jgi:hypothetical protein
MSGERQLDIFKGKRQKGTKPPPALERATHIAIADLLKWGLSRGWWYSHIPAGEKRSKATADLLHRMGTKPGMSDFLLLGPNSVCFLEIKRPPNKPTIQQQIFAAAAFKAGADYRVAYSYAEAEEILRNWGAIRTRSSG